MSGAAFGLGKGKRVRYLPPPGHVSPCVGYPVFFSVQWLSDQSDAQRNSPRGFNFVKRQKAIQWSLCFVPVKANFLLIPLEVTSPWRCLLSGEFSNPSPPEYKPTSESFWNSISRMRDYWKLLILFWFTDYNVGLKNDCMKLSWIVKDISMKRVPYTSPVNSFMHKSLAFSRITKNSKKQLRVHRKKHWRNHVSRKNCKGLIMFHIKTQILFAFRRTYLSNRALSFSVLSLI